MINNILLLLDYYFEPISLDPRQSLPIHSHHVRASHLGRHWDGSHFLPAGAGNLHFSRFPAEFVGKKSFQPSREPTNSAGNVGSSQRSTHRPVYITGIRDKGKK